MADQHQVNSIVATAICDARKEDPDHRMDPEEAKQIAKCIRGIDRRWPSDRAHHQGVKRGVRHRFVAIKIDLLTSTPLSEDGKPSAATRVTEY